MLINKLKFLFILIVIFFGSFCFSQESGGQDKYTAVNFMIERVYFTRLYYFLLKTNLKLEKIICNFEK